METILRQESLTELRVAQMLFLLFAQRNKGLVPYNLLIQNKTHQTAIEKNMIEQPMNL